MNIFSPIPGEKRSTLSLLQTASQQGSKPESIYHLPVPPSPNPTPESKTKTVDGVVGGGGGGASTTTVSSRGAIRIFLLAGLELEDHSSAPSSHNHPTDWLPGPVSVCLLARRVLLLLPHTTWRYMLYHEPSSCAFHSSGRWVMMFELPSDFFLLLLLLEVTKWGWHGISSMTERGCKMRKLARIYCSTWLHFGN